jgi:3-hydroxyacyl-[acyl-carrier-protein] dehydratase
MLQGNFFTILHITPGEATAKAALELNARHQIFEGHFPEAPVVPGVCMMQIVKELFENVLGKETNIIRVDHMKFLQFLNPEDTNLIEADLKYGFPDTHKISLAASLYKGPVIFFKFKGLLVSL